MDSDNEAELNARDEAQYRAEAERFRGIFRDPSKHVGLVENLAAISTPWQEPALLLDNATVEQAFYFATLDDTQNSKSSIASRPRLVADALATVLEGLVIQNTILVGPDCYDAIRYLNVAAPLQRAFSVIERVERLLNSEQRFIILGLARARALEILEADPEFLRSLEAAVGHQLDQGAVLTYLRELQPPIADVSAAAVPFYIDNPDHFFGWMAADLMMANHFATYGTTDDEAVEYRAGHQFVVTSTKLFFPRTYRREFFAAHVLFRAVAYLLTADILNCSYRGDGLRSVLLRGVVGSVPMRQAFAGAVLSRLEERERDHDELINGALQFEAFRVPVPLVANAVLRRAERRDQLLDIAMDIRESREARRFRRYASSVDAAISEGDRERVEKSIRDLERWGLRLAESLASSTQEFDVQAYREIVAFGSPLAAALLSVATVPIGFLRGRLRSRRFALLDELSGPPRGGSYLESRLTALWPA
jgi:hypothetical protein